MVISLLPLLGENMTTASLKSVCLLTCAALLTSGCSTFRFAPPDVDTNYRTRVDGKVGCDPHRITSTGGKADQSSDEVEINRDVDGALNLIENFVAVYRCSAREAADGRQIFEVPSLLSLVVGGIGGNFGLTDDGRLAAAAGSLVYNRANSYYAPQAKAGMLDSALDAVLCMKTASVGINFLDTRLEPERRKTREELQALITLTNIELDQAKAQLGALQDKMEGSDYESDAPENSADSNQLAELQAREIALNNHKTALQRLLESIDPEQPASLAQIRPATSTSGRVEIDFDRQYYELISSGLLSIERILARRLSAAGTGVDVQSLTTELQALVERERQLAAQEREAREAQAGTNAGGNGFTKTNGTMLFDNQTAKDQRLIEIDIDQLQVEVQQCIVRAKL